MPLAEFQKECVGYCPDCKARIWWDHDNDKVIQECRCIEFKSEEEFWEYINTKGWMK